MNEEEIESSFNIFITAKAEPIKRFKPDYKRFFGKLDPDNTHEFSYCKKFDRVHHIDMIKNNNLEAFISGFEEHECRCCREDGNIKCYFRNNSCFCERCGYPHVYDVDYIEGKFHVKNISILMHEKQEEGEVEMPGFVKYCPKRLDDKIVEFFNNGFSEERCLFCGMNRSLKCFFSKNCVRCKSCKEKHSYWLYFDDIEFSSNKKRLIRIVGLEKVL